MYLWFRYTSTVDRKFSFHTTTTSLDHTGVLLGTSMIVPE
jgi:hypothetical protein